MTNPKYVRLFRTEFSFRHFIAKDRPELVDKACLKPHNHLNAYLEVRVHTKDWVDFKDIKVAVLGSLDNLGEADDSKDKIRYIGGMDTETLVKELQKLIRIELLQKHKDVKVGLRVWETGKYGIEL